MPPNDPAVHLPALDGLRAVSILLVIVSHVGFGGIVPGGLGVTLFFAISGFIITRLLLAEWEARGRIAMGAFYARRVLRLSPALLAYAACAGLAMAAMGAPFVPSEWLAMLFYGANYYALWVGFPDHPGLAPHPFSILWSLAVEEHFYLLFPALLVALLRRGWFLPAMALGCAASLAWRFVVHAACGEGGGPEALCGTFPAYRIHMATDTRLDALLYGCALAWLCRPGGMPGWVRAGWPLLLGGAMVLASLLIRDPVFRETARHSLQSAGIVLALGPLLFAPAWGWLRAALSWPPALLVGRMSYVLYLFHWLAVGLACAATGEAMREAPYGAAWYAVFLLATLVPAAAVYWGIERPVARLRRRLRH
jgi:peptidoglycan/LPS O-acetylase OafA/YrhL